MDNHSSVICQVFKEQDLTRGADSPGIEAGLLSIQNPSWCHFLSRSRHGALHEEGGGGSLLGVWRLHPHAVHADPEAPQVSWPQLQPQGTSARRIRGVELPVKRSSDLVTSVCVCQGMMEQSKRSSLSVARSILNHKVIGKKLESYLKVCVCSSLCVTCCISSFCGLIYVLPVTKPYFAL